MTQPFTYALDDFAIKTAQWWLECAVDDNVEGTLLGVAAAGLDGEILYHIAVFQTDRDSWEILAGIEETAFPQHVDYLGEDDNVWSHLLARYGGPAALREKLGLAQDASDDELHEYFWYESEESETWGELIGALAQYEYACILEQVVGGAEGIGLSVADDVEMYIAEHDDRDAITVTQALERLRSAACEWEVDEGDAALFYATDERRGWFVSLGRS